MAFSPRPSAARASSPSIPSCALASFSRYAAAMKGKRTLRSSPPPRTAPAAPPRVIHRTTVSKTLSSLSLRSSSSSSSDPSSSSSSSTKPADDANASKSLSANARLAHWSPSSPLSHVRDITLAQLSTVSRLRTACSTAFWTVST